MTAYGATGAVRVPADINLLDQVRASVSPPARHSAVVSIRSGRGAGLRRYATAVRPTDRPERDPAGGWDDVEIPVAGLWDTARRIAGVGPDARVVSPPELRDAVRRILVGAAQRAEPGLRPTDDQVEALWP